MSDLKPELKSKFERQPSGPPPPPKRRKKVSPNAKIVADMVADNAPKKEDKSGDNDGKDRKDEQSTLPLNVGNTGNEPEVNTVKTVKPVKKVKTTSDLKLVNFKFKPEEHIKLAKMSQRHGMTQTDIVRMGLLLAYTELEAIRKREILEELKNDGQAD